MTEGELPGPVISPSSSPSPSPAPIENPDGSTTIPVTVKPPPPALPDPGTVIAPDGSQTNVLKKDIGMFSKLITGNEKAIVGGLTAGILTLVSQLGVNNQLTIKEAAYAVASWLVTHIIIWITANTPSI